MAFLLIAETCIKITLLRLWSEHPHKRRLSIYNQNTFGSRSSTDLLSQHHKRPEFNWDSKHWQSNPHKLLKYEWCTTTPSKKANKQTKKTSKVIKSCWSKGSHNSKPSVKNNDAEEAQHRNQLAFFFAIACTNTNTNCFLISFYHPCKYIYF